jgi:hypothetical protein
MPQTVLGPGTLTLGEVATAIDLSCLVNSMTVAFEKDEGDSTTKLCGDEFPGAVTYTASLTGNVDQDPGDPAGLLATSWANPGQVTSFVFTPNTANGTAASGELVLDPLDFGGETYGEIMQSDVEWTCTGTLTLTAGSGGATRELQLGQPILPAPRKRAAPITQAPTDPAPAAKGKKAG